MYLFLYPIGGLANRMRVIDSAMNLVGSTNRLFVLWIKDPGLNSNFSSIFNFQSFLKEGIHSKLFFKLIKLYDLKDKRLLFILKLLENLHFLLVLDEYTCLDKIKIKKSNKFLFCFIRTWEPFYPKDNFHRELFEIRDKARLEKELIKIDSNTIGVHIRRTDNANAIEKSPLELFEQKMLAEIKRNPKVNFYLCTDDVETKNYFKTDFWQTKVKMPDGAIERSSEDGIIQAACEMLALSKTQKILGSYWSSFGEIAARLGGIEIEICKNPE